MNRIAATAIFVAAVWVTTASAAAQTNVVEVSVPFNFTVNNTYLQAGNYSFGFDLLHPDLLVIRDQAKTVKAQDFGQRGSVRPGKPGSLIFHHYGSQYFLSEVRFDSGSNGMFLPETKSERRIRKMNRQEDVVSVAAAGLGGCSTQKPQSHLAGGSKTEPDESLIPWQKPASASPGESLRQEIALAGTGRIHTGVWCGSYATSVACSIYRAG
jgi:hypothetical protein